MPLSTGHCHQQCSYILLKDTLLENVKELKYVGPIAPDSMKDLDLKKT